MLGAPKNYCDIGTYTVWNGLTRAGTVRRLSDRTQLNELNGRRVLQLENMALN